VPPKNEPFGFFSSKGAAKTLRGRNPAILSGGADKKWNDPMAEIFVSFILTTSFLYGEHGTLEKVTSYSQALSFTSKTRQIFFLDREEWRSITGASGI